MNETSIYDLKYVFYRGSLPEEKEKITYVMLNNVEFLSGIAPEVFGRIMKELIKRIPRCSASGLNENSF